MSIGGNTRKSKGFGKGCLLMKKFYFFTVMVIGLSLFVGFSIVHKTERHGHVIGLKKEYEERYLILHKNTFPGVLERIYKSNIRNYSIFLKNGILFSHLEYIGQDFESDMAQMGDEVTKEWWKLTDPMQEPIKNRKEGEWWASMELLYEMNISKTPYQKAQRSAYMATLKSNQKQNFKDRLHQMDEALPHLYLKHNIQNLTFYYHDHRVYFYSEYVGNDFVKDMDQLFQNEPMRRLDSDLITFLEPSAGSNIVRTWIPMDEIFHTD